MIKKDIIRGRKNRGIFRKHGIFLGGGKRDVLPQGCEPGFYRGILHALRRQVEQKQSLDVPVANHALGTDRLHLRQKHERRNRASRHYIFLEQTSWSNFNEGCDLEVAVEDYAR